MTTSQLSQQSIQYSPNTIKRAERAFCCSPFKLELLTAMRDVSISLQSIAGRSGRQQGYTKKLLSEQKTESNLLWLIQVGLLRREVDGQGITDSFRLTPLGRILLEQWEEGDSTVPNPSLWERLYNFLIRWLRLPK